jgi:hypothetical protein
MQIRTLKEIDAVEARVGPAAARQALPEARIRLGPWSRIAHGLERIITKPLASLFSLLVPLALYACFIVGLVVLLAFGFFFGFVK